MVDLKTALEACENRWYNEGFADAKNSIELVINEAWKLAFGEGWLAALQAMGVPKDSPLRDPNQIPFSGPFTAIQNQLGVIDEEETTSMTELVEAIDSHAKLIYLEATSNPNVEARMFSHPLTPSRLLRTPPSFSLQTFHLSS